MAVTLLDVNLLVALAWRDHVLHGPAQRWFAGRSAGWATAPLTEAGFVRVSMNPHVTDRAVPFGAALDLLAALRRVPGHEQWTDEVDLPAATLVRRAPVVGAKQVTDVHLAALATLRGGTLATLDRGVVEALHPEDRAVVTLVPVD